MSECIIFAPHADDEIIGCFSLLQSGKVNEILFGSSLSLYECDSSKLNKDFNIKTSTAYVTNEGVPMYDVKKYKEYTLLFPDPIYETHPYHKVWGAFGLILFQRGYDVIFYSTNMNAPYIQEVKNWKEKKQALDRYYIEKSDLWKYDYKYFLFEGYTKWIRTWED